MDQQQEPRWQPTRRQLLWAGGIAALVFLIIVICGYLFEWKWTGLPKQTLWDWLNLLIVPAVLALGGYLFTRSESRRSQETAEKERTLDREIADERRQDDMLQAYLDGMSQLLTDKERPLHRAELGDYLSTMARARTTTVLQRLKGERRGSVVQFLYESGLIAKQRPVLDLKGADLGGADLQDAILIEANLRGAILSGANLREANLRGANLHEAILPGAILIEANLRGANLQAMLQGAILQGAILGGADLQDAILQGAILQDANLPGANLREADLIEANLHGAILSGADLSGTNLQYADLSGANLQYATLQGADLQDAEGILQDAEGIATEKLAQQAKSLEGATMPNGQQYEDWLTDKKGAGEDE